MEDEERGFEGCSFTKVLVVSMRAATGELIGPGLGCTRVTGLGMGLLRLYLEM